MSKPRRPDIHSRRMPPQPTDCRDAMHWFVDNYALYTGSVRGLFISDFMPDYEAYIESSVINLRSRGIEPFVASGEQLVAQAEGLWMQATAGTLFNQPHVTNFELEMLYADLAIIKDLEAPVSQAQLWYLYHYVLYPRALFNKATVVTTSLGFDEFIAYGAACDDIEYAGRKISWEKLIWLIEATMIDLYQFRQVRTDGHPPMLKAEYNLFNAMNERDLPVTAQQILGDYMLDMSIADRDNRLAVECDVLASLDPNVPNSGEAKKNLVLLSDGWKILRFTTAEILGDLTACVDAVEQVWTQGRKKSAVGRLMSGRDQPKVPELPNDDDSQKLAITHGAGPVAVTGGAGTGKTSCITHRIGYLLAQGVCPERILVFTHSEETAELLRREVEVLTDGQTVQRLNISHWRDLGLRILKENAAAIKRKAPLKVEAAPHRVLQRVVKKELKDIDPLQLELMEADIDEVSVGWLISLYKANLVTAERIKEKGTTDADALVARLYSQYDEQLRKSNKIDNDDMVFLCAQILADDADVRAKYQHKFEYVLVDEYQDCSVACDLMARLLAFPQDNIFFVGDEDECVSEGKGASPRLMADISIRMPNARCYILDKNWRSHPAIVDHSRSLSAALGIKGIVKDMLPGYGQAATSAVIGPQQCKTEEAEADWVANEVGILIESGKSPGDIVLLWRNAKYASLLEAALFKKNIRCQTSATSNEAVPDEVGDVMAFLRLVMDPDGPKARESFERFCQLKSREMDQKLSKLSNTIASFAEANNLSFLKAIEIYHDATADSACEDLAQLVRIVRTMNQEGLPPSQTIGLLKRTQRLHELYSAVKVPPGVVYEPMRKVEQLEEEAKGYNSVREFVKAKQEFMEKKDVSAEETAVAIKSFEDSKGCEYAIAFLTGMAEGLCPSETAVNFEEERRLCYVAMTRAKELLYLSYPARFEEKPVPPSPFLVEARLLAVNVYRKAVDLIQMELPPKPVQEQEPASSQSTMLTPIFTGRPERTRPAAGGARNQPAEPAQRTQGNAPEQVRRPDGGSSTILNQAASGRGPRPGSDVDDLLGSRRPKAPDGGQSSGQPIIRPAGHSANLARGGPGVPANPYVGPEADQARVVDEARQRAENEVKLKAQYEAHVNAQQAAALQAEAEALARDQQAAYLRALQEQQLKEQREAMQKAQHEEGLRRAEEEAQRRAQYEQRMRLQQEAELRAQQEAELRAQQEAILRAQAEAEAKARQEAALRAQEEAMLLAIQQEAEQQAAVQAQQEAELQAQQKAAFEAQQAAMQAQQQAAFEAQQQAALQAQQQAAFEAQQQAALQAQQQAAFEAQQQAALQAQQQAAYEAQQQAAMQAQQQAAFEAQQQAALQAQQQAAFEAQQQAALQAQQQAAYEAQQQAAFEAQQQAALQAQQPVQTPTEQQVAFEAQQQEAARAQQQAALNRVQEKAAQRAMIDLELRMQQEAAIRASQDVVPLTPEQVAAAQAPVNSDLSKVIDEQFSFPSPPDTDSQPREEVSPPSERERTKEEEIVRSNQEILQDMKPEEREQQQDILRKKAREKIVAKGRKKKGAAEPVADVAPAAVAAENGERPSTEVAAPEPVTSVETSEPAPATGVPMPEPVPVEQPQPQMSSPSTGSVEDRDTMQLEAAVSAPVSMNAAPPQQRVSELTDVRTAPVAQSEPEPPLPSASLPPIPVPLPPIPTAMPEPPQPVVNSPPPGLYGDNSVVGFETGSGVKVHKPQGAGPALPDLDQLSFDQSNPFAEAVPPVVSPPQTIALPPANLVSPPPSPAPPYQPPTPPPYQAPAAQSPYQQPASFQATPSISPVVPRSSSPQCPQCSASLEANARFCGECGLHLQVRIPSCPSCSLPLEPNARFCGECGYSLG